MASVTRQLIRLTKKFPRATLQAAQYGDTNKKELQTSAKDMAGN